MVEITCENGRRYYDREENLTAPSATPQSGHRQTYLDLPHKWIHKFYNWNFKAQCNFVNR
jgi:hypothetical protein